MTKDIDIKEARVERQKPEIQIGVASNLVLRERAIINVAQNADNNGSRRESFHSFYRYLIRNQYLNPVSTISNKHQRSCYCVSLN